MQIIIIKPKNHLKICYLKRIITLIIIAKKNICNNNNIELIFLIFKERLNIKNFSKIIFIIHFLFII